MERWSSVVITKQAHRHQTWQKRFIITFLIHLFMYLFSFLWLFFSHKVLSAKCNFFPSIFFLFGKDVLIKYRAMCHVRLIIVTDHTYQFQHIYRLGIRKYLDVPSSVNKRFWAYLPISTCLYPYRLRVRKYWDVPSTIKKRSWPYLLISTCLLARDKELLRCAKYN